MSKGNKRVWSGSGDLPDSVDLGAAQLGYDSGLWATSMASQMIMHTPNVIQDTKSSRAYAPNNWGLALMNAKTMAPNTLDSSPTGLAASDVIARYRTSIAAMVGKLPGSG